MELGGIGGAADAEGLRNGRLGEERGTGGQGEGIAMPLKGCRPHGGCDRIVAASVGQCDIAPAKFRRSSKQVAAAKGTGEDLRAKVEKAVRRCPRQAIVIIEE